MTTKRFTVKAGLDNNGQTLINIADPVNAQDAATKQYVQSNTSSTPAGTIIYTILTAAPVGYLKANGQLVSRTTYATLFSLIGTTYGAGDGSTTFKLPDFRGEFLRAWDDSRGVDTGRSIGTAQGDAIRNITGGLDSGHSLQIWAQGGGSGVLRAPAGGAGTGTVGGQVPGYTGYFDFDASRQVPTAAENRPRNVALLVCIKY